MRLLTLAGGWAVCVVLAASAACARHATVDPNRPLNRAQTSNVQTTAAEVMSTYDPRTEADRTGVNDLAQRMAAQICDREVRCHAAGSRTPEECRRANIDRSRTELEQWRCSPDTTAAHTERCLASIQAQPCDVDFDHLSALCPSELSCLIQQ